MDEWMDGWMIEGPMDRWIEGYMDRWMDGSMGRIISFHFNGHPATRIREGEAGALRRLSSADGSTQGRGEPGEQSHNPRTSRTAPERTHTSEASPETCMRLCQRETRDPRAAQVSQDKPWHRVSHGCLAHTDHMHVLVLKWK